MSAGWSNPVGRNACVLALALLLAFRGLASHAAEPAPLAASQLIDLPFEQLVTLEVSSASRYTQKIGEAPAAAVVVHADEIRAYGYRTLADVLRSMPGLYVTDDHSWSYLGVRGFSRPGDYNTRVLLLVDGYRANDNIYNQAYIGSEFLVDIDMIDRVEFVPGPGASSYGDNAFFGVINVITKSASSLQGVNVSAEAGSHNSYKTGFRYGQKLENGAEVVAALTHYDSKGRDWFFPEYGAVAHDLDEERYSKFFAKLRYQEWTFEGGYMKRPRHNPAAPYGSVFGDERLETVDTHAFANAAYNTALSETLEFSGSLYYGAFDYDGIYPYPGVLNVDRSRGRRAGAELRLLSTALDRHKLMGGIEYQKDLRQLQRNYDKSPYLDYINNDQRPHKYGIFLQDEIALRDDLMLNAGVRYDRYSQFGSTTNPRVALIYHPSPGNGLKLIYGSAYRAPNAYEMFYGDEAAEYRTNPDLRPERIKTYEAVLEHTFASSWHGTMSLFHYDVENLITQVEDNGALMFVNGHKMHTSGVELSAERQWAGGARLKGTVSYQEAKDKWEDSRQINSPHVLAKLGLILPLPYSWQAGAELQYTGDRLTTSGEADAYALANLTLTRSNILKGLDLSVSAYNLFDKEYEDPADTGVFVQDILRQDGRTFRLKLDYRF
jgi:outer membrane receptor protein involved in Fe transport